MGSPSPADSYIYTLTLCTSPLDSENQTDGTFLQMCKSAGLENEMLQQFYLTTTPSVFSPKNSIKMKRNGYRVRHINGFVIVLARNPFSTHQFDNSDGFFIQFG
jgi:hypothetical protein